jgi:hypothetical protein
MHTRTRCAAGLDKSHHTSTADSMPGLRQPPDVEIAEEQAMASPAAAASDTRGPARDTAAADTRGPARDTAAGPAGRDAFGPIRTAFGFARGRAEATSGADAGDKARPWASTGRQVAQVGALVRA